MSLQFGHAASSSSSTPSTDYPSSGLWLGARSAASWRPTKRKLSSNEILALSWTSPDVLRYATGDGHISDASTSSLSVQSTRDLHLHWDVATFSSDGSAIMGGSETQTSLWQLFPPKRQWNYSYPNTTSYDSPTRETVLAFALTSHGKEWVYAGASGHFGSVALMEARNGRVHREKKTPYGDVADALAFSNDGHYVAHGGNQIGVWSHQTQKDLWDDGVWPTNKFPLPRIVTQLMFSPDGRILAVSFDSDAIWLFHADTGVPVRQLDGNTPAVSLAFSPDGSLLAGSNERGDFFVWNTLSGHQIKNVPHAAPKHSALAFSPDSSRLAIGAASGEIQLWRIR